MIQMTLFGTVFSHGQDILHHSRTNTNGDRHMTRRKTTCCLCDVVGRQAVWTQADHCISCADIGDIGLFISAIAAAVINCHLQWQNLLATSDSIQLSVLSAFVSSQCRENMNTNIRQKVRKQIISYHDPLSRLFIKKMQSHDCYLLPLLRN